MYGMFYLGMSNHYLLLVNIVNFLVNKVPLTIVFLMLYFYLLFRIKTSTSDLSNKIRFFK